MWGGIISIRCLKFKLVNLIWGETKKRGGHMKECRAENKTTSRGNEFSGNSVPASPVGVAAGRCAKNDVARR